MESQILFAIQMMSVVLLLGLSIFVFLKWKTKMQGFLFFYTVVALVNNAGYLICMQAKTMDAYLLCLKMSYLGRVWVPFSMLLLVLAFCKKKLDRRIMGLLAMIHGCTYFLVLFVEEHSLYYRGMEFEAGPILPHINHGNGIWYTAYTALIVGYVVYGIALLILIILRETNRQRRKMYICVSVGIGLNSLCYVLQIVKLVEDYDLTMLGCTLNTIFFCIAIFRFHLIDTLQLAKDYCIEELTEGIIVVAEDGTCEYANSPALAVFPEIYSETEEIIRKLDDLIRDHQYLEWKDCFFAPEVKALSSQIGEQARVYALIDQTEHIRYTEELKKQKKIAEDANASKSAFLSIVTHEIRTPMNAVVGMTELLLRENEELSPRQIKYLNNIRTSGSALVMIVNDILDQSKLEAGKMDIIDAPYELRPMTEDVKLIIQDRIGEKPIHLVYEIQDEVPGCLVGDCLRIRQILINLMNNAVKFTEEGFIRLSIGVMDRKQGSVLLRFGIKDSGQGIRREDLNKLGQAFAQVDVLRNHSKEGTGLGLSISREFISLMGGQLEVASEYGKGTEFYFSIWQGILETEEAKQDEHVGEEKTFSTVDTKVLVVDDNDINLMIMEEYLDVWGVGVDMAQSGEEALELAKENTYDLIFMDYMMPGMNGIEATRGIREIPGCGEVPIIAVTGDNSEEVQLSFREAGVSDFTAKPVVAGHLQLLLDKWLPAEKKSES